MEKNISLKRFIGSLNSRNKQVQFVFEFRVRALVRTLSYKLSHALSVRTAKHFDQLRLEPRRDKCNSHGLGFVSPKIGVLT